MKRIFVMLFMFCAVFAFASTESKAETSFEMNELHYHVNQDGETVTLDSIGSGNLQTNSLVYIVPASVSVDGKTYAVKKVDVDGVYNQNVSKIVYSEGIEEIRMMSESSSIKEIVYPSTVKKITNLENCSWVDKLTISDKNPYFKVEKNILYSKDGKKIIASAKLSGNVQVRNGVTDIMENAFCNSELSGVFMPDSVQSIHNNSFYNCQKLKKVVMGKGVKSIHYAAFSDTKKLSSLTISKDNPYMKTVKGAVYSKNMKTLILGSVSSSVMKVNKKTKYVKEGAFYCNQKVDTVIFLGKLKEIPDYCFSYSAVKKVVLPDTVKQIGQQAFMSCNNLRHIDLPKELIIIKTNAFKNCCFFKLTIPSKVKQIELNALSTTIEKLTFKGNKPPKIARQKECYIGESYDTTYDDDDEEKSFYELYGYHIEQGITVVRVPKKSSKKYLKALRRLPYQEIAKY